MSAINRNVELAECSEGVLRDTLMRNQPLTETLDEVLIEVARLGGESLLGLSTIREPNRHLERVDVGWTAKAAAFTEGLDRPDGLVHALLGARLGMEECPVVLKMIRDRPC
jgi:hypothetical protein